MARGFQPFHLGRFDVLAPLGAGGMAEVYLGRTSGAAGFEKHVAIKRVRGALVEDPSMVQLFLQEARVTQRVRHPNIVDILELQEDEDGGFYMVLEFVDGPDVGHLASQLRKSGQLWPWKLACHVVASVLRGLAHAHDATGPDGKPLQLVHRDVSPNNILISRDGHIKLTDFGVARARGISTEQTAPGTVRGKLAYLPPETLTTTAVDQRVDVYACGVVLWELLCGCPLFGGGAPHEIIQRVINQPVPPPSQARDGLPTALDALLARALARNPDQRTAHARQFERELHALINDASPDEHAQQLAALVRDHLAGPSALEKASVTMGATRQANPPPVVDAPTRNHPHATAPLSPALQAVRAASDQATEASYPTTAPPAPAAPDFFADLPPHTPTAAPLMAAADQDWGPPPPPFWLQPQRGARQDVELAGLLAFLSAGALDATVGTLGGAALGARSAAQRLLMDGVGGWPATTKDQVRGEAQTPAALYQALEGMSGFVTLALAEGPPALGMLLVRGDVALVLPAHARAPWLPQRVLAALDVAPLAAQAVLQAALASAGTFRVALSGVVAGADARLRQWLDADGIPRVRKLVASGAVAYAVIPTALPHVDVPPATVPLAAVLGQALAGPAEQF